MKATRIVLTDNVSISNMHFYSHKNAGNLTLAIYDNSSPKQLVWQSGIFANSANDADIQVPIASGTPNVLTLTPGTYYLAWLSDAIVTVPSFSPGNFGDGLYVNASFGSFPGTLSSETISDERWTQSIDFEKRPNFKVTSASGSFVAGTSQSITITALSQSGQVQTDYAGNHTLLFVGAALAGSGNSPQANSTNFGSPTVVSFSSGTATVPVSLFKVESTSLSVTEPALSAVTTQALAVTVSHATPSRFAFSGAGSTKAGDAFPFTITAQDIYKNNAKSYTATPVLTFAGAKSSTLPVTAPTINAVSILTPQSISFTAGIASSTAVFACALTLPAIQRSLQIKPRRRTFQERPRC